MEISKIIAEELAIKEEQVNAVITLIDEGNTIPFIARYRKEVHGSLDDETLRKLDTRLQYLRNMERLLVRWDAVLSYLLGLKEVEWNQLMKMINLYSLEDLILELCHFTFL